MTQTKVIELPNRWKPRGYQQNLWRYLAGGGRRAVAKWHRRSGKDDVFLHHTACTAHQRIGNYWYMLPEYSQARKSMWDAVNSHTGRRRIDEAFPVELRKSTKDQEMMIQFHCGSTFQLVGSDNFNSLVGSPPVGLVFSEYALSNPSAWGYLRPILLENGGWAGFNSTPRGKNHFKAMCEMAAVEPGWFYEELTVDDTDVFTTFQMEAELRELQAEHGAEYGKSLWLQEYFCSFDAAIPGAIWGDCIEAAEKQGRILEFEVDRALPVDTGWDLGRTDDTAIWFRQLLGRQIDIVDHFASAFMDINNADNPDKSLVHILLKKREELGIEYGTHWLPHDARPRTLAAGGKSILQQFHDAAIEHPELGRFAICPRLDRQEGIAAGRKTFPYCRFHVKRCAKGLESLRQYHREYDQDLKIFLDTPKHDWASHDADAWRTLSLTWKFRNPRQPESPLVDRLMAMNPAAQTFGQLRDRHFAKRRAERQENYH